MIHLTFPILFAAMTALPVQPQGPAASSPPVTTIILVRHAEAAAGAGADPVLSEAGIARANALAEALKDAGVTAVVTTQYRRTVLTGEPLAAAARAPLVSTPVQGALDGHVRAIVRMVHTRHAGGTIVIIGHSNTIPALVKGLSGADVGEIAHDAYGHLFVVTTTTPGAGRVVRARYGS